MGVPKISVHTNSQEVASSSHDGLILLFTDVKKLSPEVLTFEFAASVASYAQADKSVTSQISFLVDSKAPGGRVILAPTGSLFGDTDDARKIGEIASKAVQRARQAGLTNPLLHFVDPPRDHPDYKRYLEVALLGALEACYEYLEFREHKEKIGQSSPEDVQEFGVLVNDADSENVESIVKKVLAIEEGRRLCRDTGGPDPERMSPMNFAKYVVESLSGAKNTTVTVIDDVDTLHKEYPLLHAVARCSLDVERHRPCVVRIEYKSPEPSKVKENLYFVGKGVTYDTGGADLKVNGAMRGMSRDKLGAAAVAGFMKTVAEQQPTNVNIIADLGLVRNSIGPDAYLSDEVLYSRAGVRILVGNTDAEGRMVMTDLLCHMRERVLEARENGDNTPARLFTVATLTGHAIRACGPYTCSLDNGPARKDKISQRLFNAGAEWADPCEISTLRREDMAAVAPGSTREDVVQANDKPSTMTNRGHQFPAAFMVVASGLDKHGLDAEPNKQIAYTHLDIAGSAEGDSHGLSLPEVTGRPIPSFVGAFLE
ncbi:Zn-dependent exopeptidase [Basidiobolus meristosporus CBS 931.73]|uniref:Zn-dependent exopeptidase n=1 Tax=Basidiobolus meristosporus CBS 931.73 TaxID=1314790 RepID=A0A1Y1Z0D4_9FUNG|nr:Zn-dependent exopeptidase [Basidiobolus meristosporus CBS 931.73]|eukprot:ORY03397.1 Zn-dependent exopeptidase [Basidiobolus meristosporus CBS 931.73]